MQVFAICYNTHHIKQAGHIAGKARKAQCTITIIIVIVIIPSSHSNVSYKFSK
jgi:hypothetical protein